MPGGEVRLRVQRKNELAHLKFTTRRRRRCALIHGPMRACRFPAFAFRSTFSGTMRAETDAAKLMAFMAELGNRVRGPGRIYFAGGATALLHGWRSTTIDVDLKPDPEPPGLFEALAVLKDELDINVELAQPRSIHTSCAWLERAQFVYRASWTTRVFSLRSVRPDTIETATPARSRHSGRALVLARWVD